MIDGSDARALRDVPFPTVRWEQIAQLAERYQLSVSRSEVQLLRSTGIMHSVYALGDHLVLRVPKHHREAIADTYTGSLAAPVAVAAGVRTPALVAFDDQRDIAPVPLSVFERAIGEPLVHMGARPQNLASLWRDVGADLARLHHNVTACDDPDGRLDTPDYLADHEPLLDELGASGIIGTDAGSWLGAVLDRLKPAITDRAGYRRFVHGDVQPSNLLAQEGRYSAMIDWDDAGWADPVVDLRYLPLRVADLILEGYRSVAPVDGDDTAEERLMWDKLTGALRRLWRLPRHSDGTISGTPAGPLIELLAAASDTDAPITRLLRR